MGSCSSSPEAAEAPTQHYTDTSTGVTRQATSSRRRRGSPATAAPEPPGERVSARDDRQSKDGASTVKDSSPSASSHRSRLLMELYQTENNSRFAPLDISADRPEKDPALRLHEELRQGMTWSLNRDNDLDEDEDAIRSDALWLASEAAKSSGGATMRGMSCDSVTGHATSPDERRDGTGDRQQSLSSEAAEGLDAYLATHPNAPPPPHS